MNLIPKLTTEDFTLILEIPEKLDSQVPLKVLEFAKSKRLSVKDIFHITVLGSNQGEELMTYINDDLSVKQDAINFINKAAMSSDFSLKLLDSYFYIEKSYPHNIDADGKGEMRSSIIQLAEFKGVEQFYNNLNNQFNLRLIPPFPHVTLFTGSTVDHKVGRGVGVYTELEFRNLKPLEL